MAQNQPRKAIQIQALRFRGCEQGFAGDDQEPKDAIQIVALCDDGTIWTKYPWSDWDRVDGIPQTDK